MSTNHLTDTYPEQAAQRDRWILEQRDARGRLDPLKPHAFLVEEERADSGEIVPVATIFLTNRECPWRCLMCDLWKNTHTESVSLGAIPAQIDFALAELVKQGGGGFEPARSGDVAVAGINRDQRRSRVRQTATPTLQMSRQRRSPSSRPSPPTAVELSELQRTWSADFSPLPEELPQPEGGGLKSALLNSRAVPSPPREGETGESGSPLSASRARLAAVIPAARQIKLYNSGSFFDPRAIPPEDHEGIARRVA